MKQIYKIVLYQNKEHGFILLDVLISVLIFVILNGFLWSMLQFSWHLYDKSSSQMEATDQVSIFLQQWRQDIEESNYLQVIAGIELYIKFPTGKTVQYIYNGSPTVLHIYRLVNGRGGEVACTHVIKSLFELDSSQSAHVKIDVADKGTTVHYVGYANSHISE